MNKSRTIISPANGMRVNTWVVYQRQMGDYIAVDHAGKSFYGRTELDAVLNRACNGRVFPCLNRSDAKAGIVYV